jgi:hypothetical protein
MAKSSCPGICLKELRKTMEHFRIVLAEIQTEHVPVVTAPEGLVF